MARPLTIFCGKGGVGKTSLSLAFALWHAGQGQNALVVTSHPLRELALSVSLAGLKESHPQAAANLFVVHIDPHEVLSSTIKRAFKSAPLVDALLSSRVYQSLIEVVPGLKEIAFLSRVQQLAQQGSGEQVAEFDLLVWDAPATGHFLRTLETSKRFDSYLSGPLAILGKDLANFFSDSTNLTLLPVTILEEMAVEETIELNNKLIRELNMRPAGFICNMASPLIGSPDAVFETLQRDVDGETKGPGGLRFILDRHAIERELFRKLRRAMGIAPHIVQRKSAWNSDVELLLDISQQLAKSHGAWHT